MELALLPTEQFVKLWPQFEQGLAQSRMLDFWDKDALFEAGKTGTVQVWGLADKVIDLILFTDIMTYGNGVKSLRFIGGFGEGFDKYESLLLDTFRQVATSLSCQKVEVLGRVGWGRKLKSLGFKHSHSVFFCDVDRQGMEH